MRTAFLLMALAANQGLLPAQTAADPKVRGNAVEWFELNETMDHVARLLGRPSVDANFGSGLRSWQFHLGQADSHEPSHYLVFDADGKLMSVTRSYDPEIPVDALFQPAETEVHYLRGDSAFGVRLRRLRGGRVLLAIGSVRQGQPVGQLVLMRETDLPSQYPWIRLPERERPGTSRR